ncbi:MAG: NAD(P)/FAD-dependent oxidoreductase [Pseudomonadota bacterium]
MAEIVETEILIVGGGPAGLSCAARLSADVDALIVHQDKEIGKPVRTSGGSWLSDMTRLGVPETLYNRVAQIDVYSDNREMTLDTSDDPAVILDVTGLYKWLAEDVRVPIHCSTKFLGAQRVEGGFLSRMRTAGKGEWQVKSRKIVDASGWHCAVLESLGLGKKPDRTGVGYECEFPIGEFDQNRGILFFGSSALTAYGWVFPTGYGTIRVGVGVLKPVSDQSPKDVMTHFMASDDWARMGLPEVTDSHVNAGTIPSVAYDPQLIFGDVIRVGDSANMATPTLGEGLRIVIEQGRLLGDALSAGPAAVTAWERQATRKFKRNYWIGFLVNSAAAQYTPAQWDRSVDRMARLPGPELRRYFKNDFTTGMLIRRVCLLLWRKLTYRFIK